MKEKIMKEKYWYFDSFVLLAGAAPGNERISRKEERSDRRLNADATTSLTTIIALAFVWTCNGSLCSEVHNIPAIMFSSKASRAAVMAVKRFQQQPIRAMATTKNFVSFVIVASVHPPLRCLDVSHIDDSFILLLWFSI
jgi:hypothetical protein